MSGPFLIVAPTRIGKYALLAPVGRGGMAEVHLARRDGEDELCVLKLLLEEHGGRADLLRRFKREARVMSLLDDPRIVRAIDAGEADGRFYLALEYIRGQPLAKVLERLRGRGQWISAGLAIRIAIEVLEGLDHAHTMVDPEGASLDLVHRDLAPGNMMIAYKGAVKIIDFGVAKADVDDFRTQAGGFVGTVRYMSPEQALSLPVTRTSDVYALSVVLWELLAKRRLVVTAPIGDMIRAIVSEPPPDLGKLAPHLPPAVVAVVEKGLKKRAHERYATAAEMASALRTAATNLDVPALGALSDLMQKLYADEQARLDVELEALVVEHTPPSDMAMVTATLVGVVLLDWDQDDVDAQVQTLPENDADTTARGKREVSLQTALFTPTSVPTPVSVRILDTIPVPIQAQPKSNLWKLVAGSVVIGAALTIGVLTGVRLRSDQADAEPATPSVAVEARPVPSAPSIVARTPAADPIEIQPGPASAPPGSARAARREAPASKAPPAVVAPSAPDALALKIGRLEADPKNGGLLLEVYRSLVASSQSLPAEEGAALRQELDAALRTGDVESFGKAYRRIVEKARGVSTTSIR